VIVDTHAHLTYRGLVEDTDNVLKRARAEGVGAFITVGIDGEDSRRAYELAKREADVYCSVGVHPHDTESLDQKTLDELALLALEPEVVAWGETGLDFFRNHSPAPLQRKWFKMQAAMARDLDLPLIVHDRDAHEETLAVLRELASGGLRGVVHCFSGDLAYAKEVIKLGFFISIPGTVTYPKNTMLQEVVKGVPLERCLLETDCPFLTPQPFRGKRNEPAYIVHTAAKVAELKGLSLDDVGRITTRGAKELFGIGEVEEGVKLAYRIRNSLYLNITGRCTNRCVFCAKNISSEVKGHDLTLSKEPSVEEVLKAVEDEGGAAAFDEVVFCGFGESLLRIEEVKTIARELKARGAKSVRVNTDGLANLVHGRDVTYELAGLIDEISVSLNAPDATTYEKICRPQVEGAYPALLDFLKKAAENIETVTATAVELPGLDVEACERVAGKLNVNFRRRPFNEVG